MVYTINYTAALYPALMLVIGAITVSLNLWLAKKSNIRFKKEQMDLKADIKYVDKENRRIERETDLKLEIVKESQEEFYAIIDKMGKQINYIYEKHYTP